MRAKGGRKLQCCRGYQQLPLRRGVLRHQHQLHEMPVRDKFGRINRVKRLQHSSRGRLRHCDFARHLRIQQQLRLRWNVPVGVEFRHHRNLQLFYQRGMRIIPGRKRNLGNTMQRLMTFADARRWLERKKLKT